MVSEAVSIGLMMNLQRKDPRPALTFQRVVAYAVISAAGVATSLYLLFGALGPQMDWLADTSCMKGNSRWVCLTTEQGKRWYRGD